jgi:hypothetical protein
MKMALLFRKLRDRIMGVVPAQDPGPGVSGTVNTLCEESADENEECPNTASVPSMSLSKKRTRDQDESVDDLRHRNANGKQSAKRNTAGKRMQTLEGAVEVPGHCESHESLAVAAALLNLKNLGSEQASKNDGSANEHSQKRSTSKPPTNASRQRKKEREDRLSELADFRKRHGHCHVPQNYSGNPKLANWVGTQRKQHKCFLEGKKSPMTTFRIQELESEGFEWKPPRGSLTPWEDRLSELADYSKIHGHCNVPISYSENAKLGAWVGTQRTQYSYHVKGKQSQITIPRIQALESLGFEWIPSSSRMKGTRKTPSLDDVMRGVHKESANSRQGANIRLETAPAPSTVIVRATGYY